MSDRSVYLGAGEVPISSQEQDGHPKSLIFLLCSDVFFFFFLFLYPMSLKSMIPHFVYFLTLLFFLTLLWCIDSSFFMVSQLFQYFRFSLSNLNHNILMPWKKMLPLKWKQQKKKLQQKNFLFFQEYEKNFGVNIHRPSRVVLLLNKSRWSSATQTDGLTL